MSCITLSLLNQKNNYLDISCLKLYSNWITFWEYSSGNYYQSISGMFFFSFFDLFYCPIQIRHISSSLQTVFACIWKDHLPEVEYEC